MDIHSYFNSSENEIAGSSNQNSKMRLKSIIGRNGSSVACRLWVVHSTCHAKHNAMRRTLAKPLMKTHDDYRNVSLPIAKTHDGLRKSFSAIMKTFGPSRRTAERPV